MKTTQMHGALLTAVIAAAVATGPAASAAPQPGPDRSSAAGATAVLAAPVVTAPVRMPGGAVVDVSRLVLHTAGSAGGGGSADGWMAGTVTDMPAGHNELSADLRVDLTVGCVTRAGRSAARLEQRRPLRATWRAAGFADAEGASWGPRLGLGEDFGMQPSPWEVLPASCPRGLTPAVVRSTVTSATVRYSHDGVRAPAIKVRGVFSYQPGNA